MSAESPKATPSWPPAPGTMARRLWDMSDEEVEELFDRVSDRGGR